MSLIITLVLLAATLALTGLFGWLGARPKVPGRPRMAPWQFLMMLSASFALLMAVHLLNLFGLQTGGQAR
ncbi:MAG: hypothetical protein P4L73_14935 [Caulobacteraceae bacterium]|nr:hypothetical protein [Caulobacteraceae bacterium]